MFEIESAKTRFQGISKHLFSLLFLVFFTFYWRLISCASFLYKSGPQNMFSAA
jgi:hypothetical protein